MKLTNPIIITPRLLPGVQIGGAFISIECESVTSDNRDRYAYNIDIGDYSQSGNDLKSGCGGGSLQSGLALLLCFLGAAAESYRYKGMEGENADPFPERVVEWAAQYSDEIAMLQCEIEETADLIED